MLTAFDDHLIHQTAEPVARPASGDPNVFDRYLFSGFDVEGALCFGATLAVYPNREVVDAAFSVVRDGTQRSVHASARAPLDRAAATRVGPIAVKVLEPLRRLRVSVDDVGLGLCASLTFDARFPAVEEPRLLAHGPREFAFDCTRFAQWGRWEGTIRVDGDEVVLSPSHHHGVRERCWGMRPLGLPRGGAPARSLPQLFSLWAALQIDARVAVVAVNERADGSRWHQAGLVVGSAPSDGAEVGAPEVLRDVAVDVRWTPGTRWARHAAVDLTSAGGGADHVELEPIALLPLRGLGSFSPDWANGAWKGELVVGGESWRVAHLDPQDPANLHVHQVVRARSASTGSVGVGLLELLAINDHLPSGLVGLFDGAR